MISEDYLDVQKPGSYTGLYQFYKSNNHDFKEVESALSKLPSYTLHKKVKKTKKNLKTVVKGIDHIWQADLIDVSNIANENKDIKFLLTCIDVFSKYGWAIPLKNKSAIEVTKGFSKILSERKPEKLQTDNGTEFYNSNFKELLKLNKIKLNSSRSLHKAAVVERFNRTLRALWRYFTHKQKNSFMEKLDEFLISYNNTFHYTIKMKPSEVNKNNELQVWENIYGFKPDKGVETLIKPTFKRDDIVRISKYKYPFEKGYTKNWTSEIFVIYKVYLFDPPFYKIKDFEGTNIEGSYYENELLKVRENLFPEGSYPFYPIEKKIIKGKIKKIKVHWIGYPDSEDSWIFPEQIQQ